MTDSIEHHGVKGMHWGQRKKEYTRDDLTDNLSNREYRRRRLQIEAREEREGQARRKTLEKTTGVKYRKDAFTNTSRAKEGAIKKHYSNDEIRTARANQQAKADTVSALNTKYGKDGKKWIFSEEHQKAYEQYIDSRDRVVANYKTSGEKFVATALFGVAGAYATSDKRAIVRTANAKTLIKWKT